ncbi:dna mismatch repair [Trichoderma arundinaceum]|uniref:Dna mismatch repair n=1 Tax=Trichoderma arundinaceum TaxID=490622 RepID=A0A395NHN9_TRIAR|nr:dna mismatch repair [Trichoderma arundinaceum]
MPISALSQSTVRLLGSSVVITKPCDVVKELIDNAIDAGASLVEIAISPNFLDTIRVRDDGHGIDIDDFDALGRRAHTSKLKAFDELGLRARETLGFRGEALAAMNTFAAVIITTRTAKEVIATRLQLHSVVGGVENRRPVSAPIGTTVQITKLFETLPARKQYCLKNSAKYIQFTKDLLKAYALARPHLRLLFKVLGEASHCWSYTPTSATGVNEAALQIFGKLLANSCIHVSRNSGCDRTAGFQLDQQPSEDFILEALIPKPDFDVQAVKGKGLYLSIDSRPASSTCAIAKKLMTIFKIHLHRIADSEERTNISSPFIRLNIRCPPYSYDANVMPLKDEVVFGDEDKVMTCFEGLCRKIYPKKSLHDPFLARTPLKHHRESDILTATMNHVGGMQPHGITDGPLDTHASGHAVNIQPLYPSKQRDIPQKTSHGDQPSHRRGVPSLSSLQPPSEDGISLVKMRTSKTVNMSRTKSSSTDEDSTINSVDIQVPRSLTTATQVPLARRAGGGAKIPKLSASENIKRYLISRENEAFPIATDETATKRTKLPSPLTSPPAAVGRMPLQPLTESVLNVLNDQIESESEASSAELEVLESINNLETASDTPQGQQRAQRISPNPMLSPLELGPLEPHSPSQLRSVTEWPTPPSSGLLRGARPFVSQFRPLQRPPQRDSPTGNTISHARPRFRATERDRVIPFTLPGQNRQRPAAHRQTAQRTATLSTPRSNVGETRLQLHAQGVHRFNHQRDNSTRDFMRVSKLASQPDIRDHVSQTNLPSLDGLGRRSHLMQRDLMKGLSPSVTLTARMTQDVPNADGGASTTQTRDSIPLSDASVHDAPQDTAPLRKMSGGIEDPRLYLIKRRRSQARHGIARRISSRRLPLEAIPNRLTMQNASTSRRISLRKVKTLARQARLLRYDDITGDWGYAIEFKSMEEAGKVESRLQHAVESWQKTQNQAIEVEYKLRSAAKGKNTSH